LLWTSSIFEACNEHRFSSIVADVGWFHRSLVAPVELRKIKFKPLTELHRKIGKVVEIVKNQSLEKFDKEPH
jgi:hypothetical protein